MANDDKPIFSEKLRARNPILKAEDTNGFFQADRRQRLAYGTRFNHLFGSHKNEYGEQKATFSDFFRAMTKPRKMIRSDNEELYLTGISGRDIIEARYLQLAINSKQAPLVITIAMSFVGIMIGFFLNWSLVSTWLMAISYLVLFREIVVDVCFSGPTTSAGTGSSELQKWRHKKNASDHLAQLLLDIVKICAIGVIVFCVVIVLIFAIIACVFVVGDLYYPLYEDFIALHLPYWNTSHLTFFPQLVIATVMISLTLMLLLTRGFRHERVMRKTLKTFEEGRREYDQYMMTGIIKDLPDATQWIRFYYDRVPAPDYDHHASQGRQHEAPAKMIAGFNPNRAVYQDTRKQQDHYQHPVQHDEFIE